MLFVMFNHVIGHGGLSQIVLSSSVNLLLENGITIKVHIHHRSYFIASALSEGIIFAKNADF